MARSCSMVSVPSRKKARAYPGAEGAEKVARKCPQKVCAMEPDIWREAPPCQTVFRARALARSLYLKQTNKQTLSLITHRRCVRWRRRSGAREMYWVFIRAWILQDTGVWPCQNVFACSRFLARARSFSRSLSNTKGLYTNSPSLSLALLNAQYPRSKGNVSDMPISVLAIAGSEREPPQEMQWIPVRVSVQWPWWRSQTITI